MRHGVGRGAVRGLTGAVLVALMAALAACGTQSPGPAASEQPSTSASSPASTPAPTAASEEDATVVLYVSNQSFEDETVRMTVRVDGAPVADRDFMVEGQHTWVPFYLALEPGSHDVEVESDTGSSATAQLDLPGPPAKRWVVASYWTEDSHASITVDVHDGPIGFA